MLGLGQTPPYRLADGPHGLAERADGLVPEEEALLLDAAVVDEPLDLDLDGAEVDDVAEERVAVEDHLGARRVRVVRYHHVVQAHGDCKFHGEKTQNIIPRAISGYSCIWFLLLLSRHYVLGPEAEQMF